MEFFKQRPHTGVDQMKYVSIDIETSGLDPEEHQILEIGAVVDNLEDQKAVEELPQFHRYLRYDQIYLDPSLGKMHQNLLADISTADNIQCQHPRHVASYLIEWLSNHFNQRSYMPPKIRVAGKNFLSFDLKFLKKLPGFYLPLDYRILDPGILYLEKTDKRVPSLDQCIERAGLKPTDHHRALGDAIDVVRLIRHKVNQQ